MAIYEICDHHGVVAVKKNGQVVFCNEKSWRCRVYVLDKLEPDDTIKDYNDVMSGADYRKGDCCS